ncbi:MAG: hypothetical protein QM756_36180 [Polyangiaceae bacterium]
MTTLDRPTLLSFLIGDFESAWDALALRPQAPHRGNFSFGLQVMVLLELACRQLQKPLLQELTTSLKRRDERYFTLLPGSALAPHFTLPGLPSAGKRPLLHAIFDLTRNGLAHQYQQILARLSDSQRLGITLTGVNEPLAKTFEEGRPRDHLTADIDPDGNVWITLRTDVLFLDVRDAIAEAGVATAPLIHIENPTDEKKVYTYTSNELIAALTDGNHFLVHPKSNALGFVATTSSGGMPTGAARPLRNKGRE